jgi:hypothetical protein
LKEVTRWWAEIAGSRFPWLILGKGPSLERRKEYDLGPYRTLSLNHAVCELAVDAAHVIDIDVVADCADAIERNARVLVMPRHPHVGSRATARPLEGFFAELPLLAKLSREDRLVWYDLETGPPQPPSPRIPLGYFSGEVAVSLLATLGARTLRTLGVDGGTAYAHGFRSIEQRTKFANRHATFDLQWDGIAAAVRRHDVDFAPLTTEIPLRVYVGCDETQKLAARVLEWSIRKHCPLPLVFDTMDDVKVRAPRDPHNQPRTGFSFHRFAIPQRAGRRGRALYLDADMLVLRNLLELWEVPWEGAAVLHAVSPNPRWPKQLSVLKLDCAELDWDVDEIVDGLDRGDYDYDALMSELCIEPPERVRAGLPPEWNSLELYEPGRTALLHYTRMSKQPWVSCRNPNGDLWVDHLQEAIAEGFVGEEELAEAAARGWIRPSLGAQLRCPRALWPLFRRSAGPLRDLGFRPHRALKERLAPAR